MSKVKDFKIIRLDDIETERLSINQPFLEYNRKNNKISWKLLISMYCDFQTKNAILYDVSNYLDKKETIIDQYEIEINLSWEINIPETKETAWRLKAIAEKMWIPLENLHVSDDWTCCLMPISQTYYNFLHNRWLIYYFEKEIYPYFYSQSYFQKFRVRPFWEFSHWWQWNLEYFNSLPFEIKNEIIEFLPYSMQKWILNKIISGNYIINSATKCTCWCWERFVECKKLTTKDKYLIIELFWYLREVKEKCPYVIFGLIDLADRVLKKWQPVIARF